MIRLSVVVRVVHPHSQEYAGNARTVRRKICVLGVTCGVNTFPTTSLKGYIHHIVKGSKRKSDTWA